MYDLRTETGIEALKFLRHSIYSDTEPGQLIRINLQYSQLESGIGEPLLEYPSIYIPYLTPTWLLSVRQFMSRHNMSIVLSDPYTLLTRNKSDQFIMQQQHLSRYSTRQQSDINLVRIYLQATTLADLTNPDNPKAIRLSAIDGNRSEGWIDNPLWPRQHTPTKAQRRLWKRYLSSSYLRYIPYWKQPPTEIEHQPVSTPLTERPSPPTSFDSLADYIATLPRTQRRLLNDMRQQATDLQVWRAFRSKAKIYIASDGGLDNTTGTHGWVISTKKHALFRGSGPVDGPPDTASSTRSELAGCAASILLVVCVARVWGLRHRSSFGWITDSRAAISRIQRYARRHRGRTMPNDADLLSLIASLMRELRRPFTPEWVKGHQDTLESYANLPFKARLNIDADFLATRYRQRGRLKSSIHTDHQHDQKVSILIQGVRLTSQIDASIRFHINGYHLRQYMQERHGWTDTTWADIDFGLFGQHFKRLRPNHRVTHMKRVHGQLPLGRRRHQQARTKDPTLELCPCCKQYAETSTHLLQCDKNPVHYKSLQQLRRDIVNNDTHPVRYLLIEGLEQWSHTEQISSDISQFPTHLHLSIRDAMESQTNIGWEEALSGFLSTKWARLACCDMYNPDVLDKGAGNHRMRECITAIYNHARRLWMARNEVLHSTDDEHQQSIRSVEIAEIKDMFSKPHLLRAGDRHYCERSMDKLIEGSASTRRKWLRRVRKSIAEQKRDGGIQSQITSYFAPRREVG
jgi:hypothetical protein